MGTSSMMINNLASKAPAQPMLPGISEAASVAQLPPVADFSLGRMPLRAKEAFPKPQAPSPAASFSLTPLETWPPSQAAVGPRAAATPPFTNARTPLETWPPSQATMGPTAVPQMLPQPVQTATMAAPMATPMDYGAAAVASLSPQSAYTSAASVAAQPAWAQQWQQKPQLQQQPFTASVAPSLYAQAQPGSLMSTG